MSRGRPAAFVTLFATCLACGAPSTDPGGRPGGAAVQVMKRPAAAPPAVLVRGRVTDGGGQPLSLAHARIFDAAGEVVEEVQAGPDGSFALPRAKVQGS